MKGHQVPCNVVQLLFSQFVPEGCCMRKCHRLNKEKSIPNEGPNASWHADGYDKLKPHRFAKHGVVRYFGCLSQGQTSILMTTHCILRRLLKNMVDAQKRFIRILNGKQRQGGNPELFLHKIRCVVIKIVRPCDEPPKYLTTPCLANPWGFNLSYPSACHAALGPSFGIRFSLVDGISAFSILLGQTDSKEVVQHCKELDDLSHSTFTTKTCIFLNIPSNNALFSFITASILHSAYFRLAS